MKFAVQLKFLCVLGVHFPKWRSSSAFSFAPATYSRPSAVALNMESSGDALAGEDPYSVATLLLGTVIERRAQELDFSFDALLARLTPSYEEARERQKQRIEGLIDRLRSFDNQYDPVQALLGDFYATLYWYYPNPSPNNKPPLWEQLSLKVQNVKGQQYYFNKDFSRKVKNYAEIWGTDIFVTAEGSFDPIETPTPPTKKNPVLNLLQKPKPEIDDRLRQCPDTFKVTATKTSLQAWGIKFDFAISGSSNLVVLYADRRMRVFVSPLPSNSAVGTWEEAGLVVVQVRGDLIYGDDYLDLI